MPHSSFGCQDKIKWTYFGDAIFNRALRRTADLRSAFAMARQLISVRERHEGLVPSNPQIAGGKNIDIMLAERRGATTAQASKRLLQQNLPRTDLSGCSKVSQQWNYSNSSSARFC